jgi:hypothetical protein
MKKITYLAILCIVSLITTSVALAKESADKISISGPGLSEPIEITDPKILNQFNPYASNFLDLRRGVLAEPPKNEQLYQVLFYFYNTGGTLEARYAFQYALGQNGPIYLPGKNDELYKLNSILLREGFDGHWITASSEWDDLMQRLLEGDRKLADRPRVITSNINRRYAFN